MTAMTMTPKHRQQYPGAGDAKTDAERVTYLRRLIARFGYFEGETDAELAEVWTTTAHDVRGLARIARGRMDVATASAEEIRATLLCTLFDVIQDARARGQGAVAIKGIDSLCRILGLEAPRRHEVSGAGGAALISPEVARRMAAEVLAMGEPKR